MQFLHNHFIYKFMYINASFSATFECLYRKFKETILMLTFHTIVIMFVIHHSILIKLHNSRLLNIQYLFKNVLKNVMQKFHYCILIS